MNFASNLQKLRKKENMSQESLAEPAKKSKFLRKEKSDIIITTK